MIPWFTNLDSGNAADIKNAENNKNTKAHTRHSNVKILTASIAARPISY